MKTKERTNKKTKEMLKEDRLTIGCARVYISVPQGSSCQDRLCNLASYGYLGVQLGSRPRPLATFRQKRELPEPAALRRPLWGWGALGGPWGHTG